MAFFRHQSTLRSTRGLMLRLAQAAEITDTTQQLRIVWMRIDPSLQRDVAEPNAGTSVATFMQQLDQRYGQWLDMANRANRRRSEGQQPQRRYREDP
ncbi:uncharacterized protein N7506_001028 [Penicillium brevicompactum]|uniref:uncharacterized protein n=1 Tax=Penicillium brevicompactum TaxID=5074 RepID=UPI00254244F5|nr:uncharacterized protein N7506_001028 [Penicillium brevicompactum]KAJ5347775.1 hypothetical protein N7506_001028 [Penicillium brevicompactum]